MTTYKPPDSILILGAGVFGLSTAYTLAQSPAYSSTKLTLVSYTFPIPLSKDQGNVSVSNDIATKDSGINDPATARMASVDNSRIIRPDYANKHYAYLAAQAQEIWRHGEVGQDGRYSESGLVLVDNGGAKSYARQSLANVLEQAANDSKIHIKAEALESDEKFRNALGNGEDATTLEGKFAYVNHTSGWADAGAAMRWLQQKVMETGRVEFIQDEVQSLILDSSNSGDDQGKKQRVAGANLKSGTPPQIKASLTILATGAWTPSLIDMTNIAQAHMQCALYLSLSDDEARRLRNARVLLNLDHGCFYFPPAQTAPNSNDVKQEGNWSIKLARHAYGYINPISIPKPPGSSFTSSEESSTSKEEEVKISLPPTTRPEIPQRDTELLLAFAEEHIPSLNIPETKSQRSIKTRHCTYLDTLSGDFIVSYHPLLENLFIVTGGSGHGFKFLPVIGEKAVGVLEGKEEEEKWAEIWKWPIPSTNSSFENQSDSDDKESENTNTRGVWCEDGSRSGEINEILSEYPMTQENP